MDRSMKLLRAQEGEERTLVLDFTDQDAFALLWTCFFLGSPAAFPTLKPLEWGVQVKRLRTVFEEISDPGETGFPPDVPPRKLRPGSSVTLTAEQLEMLRAIVNGMGAAWRLSAADGLAALAEILDAAAPAP